MSVRDVDEPVGLSGLNALLTTAASNSPDHILVEDDEGASTARQIELRTRRLATQLTNGGLAPGERVLIVAGAQSASFVAIMATLRAGLEPVLAPCHAGPVELATFAHAAGAAALIGPTRYGGCEFGETYLAAAAAADTIRGILTHGPDRVDGTADISPATLDALPEPAATGHRDSAVLETPTIATLAGPWTSPTLVSHRQISLFADALSLVEQARIDPSKRVVALLPPTSLAGLVSGPFAAFVGASRLVLHGPFAAKRFLAHCDAAPGAHIVAPFAFGRCLAGQAYDVSSLILVSRFAGADAFALPPPLAFDRPVVDLYAFGEDAVLAQCRENGEAVPPARVAGLKAADGLGARLNRARAEHRLHSAEAPW